MYLTAETDFGLNMLRNGPVNDSLVVSPISVIFALAMVRAGAKGPTKSQIDSVISKGGSDRDIEEHYSKLYNQIMNAKRFKIEKEYEDDVQKNLHAKVEALDFVKANESAKVIDDFISKTTEGKIRDMVKERAVRGASALIVNAIYFTAEMEEQVPRRIRFKWNILQRHRKRKKGKILE
ncbi:hypothetical protein COOONC_05037 [Cooperia oncophora]